MYDFSKDPRPKMSVRDIIVKPGRIRKDFSFVLQMRENIESEGLIQPIVLTNENGKPTLIAGETRLKACMLIPQMNGQIPFVMKEDLPPLQQKKLELYENIFRKDVEWSERIEALAQIHDLEVSTAGQKTKENPEGWSLKKTAELSGDTPQYVGNQIAFAKKLRLDPELKERTKNLPLHAAIRVGEVLEQTRRTERLQASGELQLTKELVHSDALTFLKAQKDNSIDLFLTDPPFAIGELEDRREVEASISNSYMAQLKPSDNGTTSSVLSTLELVLPEMFRTLKPGSYMYMFFDFCLVGELKQMISKVGFNIRLPVIIWDKKRTTTKFSGYNYQSCYEMILFCHKPPNPRRLSEASSAIISVASIHASKKLHVFEKPSELLISIIRRSTNLGDLVCDPFAGSASTLLAATQCGRRAIGCELDRENWLKAQDRLIKETPANGISNNSPG